MPKTSKKSKSTGKKQSMQQLKMEAANEVGVNLDQGGQLSARDAGSVGGQMVKNMVQNYKKKK